MLPSDVDGLHPGRHMGYNADIRKNSRNPQAPRAVKDKITPSLLDQRIRLSDQLKFEKPISKSYGDLHEELKHALGDGPLIPRKSFINHQKQTVEKKAKEDELVKYMSNLPQYLQRVEKGENHQENVLNFGVLDWGRLENWKHNQKPVAHSSFMDSPSTSNTSSPFSTVGSSTLSTRSDSGGLTHRSRSPSRGAHLASSSKDGQSVVLKPTTANVASHQDKVKFSMNASGGQQNLSAMNVPSQRSHSKMKFDKGMKNGASSKFSKEMGTLSSSSKNCDLSFSPKGKTKIPAGEYTPRPERFRNSAFAGQHCDGRDKTIVLLLPKNLSKNRFPGPSQNAEFTTFSDNKRTEPGRSSFSDGFCINEEVQFSELYSEIPHSCLQLSRMKPGKQSDTHLLGSVNSLGFKAPSGVSQSLSRQGELRTVRLQHMQAEENKLTTKPIDLMALDHSKGPGLKAAELKESGLKEEERPSARCGNQSPNRWSSVGRDKISRSLSFKEGSALPQFSSTYQTTKSGPVESEACSDRSNREKSTSNIRARSSPLRRLLDPLLRPKTANRLTSVELFHDDGNTMCKSTDIPFSSSVQPVKRNTELSGSIPADSNRGLQNDKHGVPMVQALLKIAVKNGLPWFTFAVDSNNDILAATMTKTSSSEKYDCSWVYTFYSFRKAKKKSGSWMGNGSKARNQDYVPTIIAQMKVNGPRCTKLTTRETQSRSTVREFVLFNVEPRKADQETPNLVSNVELAAIVIKFPTETAQCLTSDRQQRNGLEDLSYLRSPECSMDKKCSHYTIGDRRSGHLLGSQSISNAVVILPSGVHGLSATGFPSPLLDRWTSGGSCDCGGWDEGCQLRVLSSEEQPTKNSDSTKLCFQEDKFHLFAQGGGFQESIPFLSFATYNEGVHSIEFNASISTLQSFSVCIAFLHCNNLVKVSNLFQGLTSQEPISVESERVKLSTQTEGKAPSSRPRFPPPSPVGRV